MIIMNDVKWNKKENIQGYKAMIRSARNEI